MNVRKCNEYIPIVPLYGNNFNQVIFSLVFCLIFLIKNQEQHESDQGKWYTRQDRISVSATDGKSSLLSLLELMKLKAQKTGKE